MSEIRGYSISEIEEFVGKRSDKYIERFQTLKKFNWVAAIFKYAWFGYRKIYVEGIIVYMCELLVAVLGVFIIPFIIQDENVASSVLKYFNFLCMTIEFVVIGLLADRIYWINIKKRINYAQLPKEVREKKMGITTFHKTCKGTSIWSIIILNIFFRVIEKIILCTFTFFARLFLSA